MKKVVNVHLAGQLFQMEEDGYNNLQRVLKRITNSSSDGLSVASDMEQRMASMIQERGWQTSVITYEQIHEIITHFGLAGYLGPEANYFQSRPRQLFRHPSDKVIGGVCGGLAVYFDVEPVLIRLAFVVLFFGVGTGFLLYLILWMVVPMANHRSF